MTTLTNKKAYEIPEIEIINIIDEDIITASTGFDLEYDWFNGERKAPTQEN